MATVVEIKVVLSSTWAEAPASSAFLPFPQEAIKAVADTKTIVLIILFIFLMFYFLHILKIDVSLLVDEVVAESLLQIGFGDDEIIDSL